MGVLPAGSRVVILDRGDHHNVAILLARKFAAEGAQSVDILDPTGAAARTLDALNRFYLTRDFAAERIRLASDVTGFRVDGSTVTFEIGRWPQAIEGVDALVVLEPPAAADPGRVADLGEVVMLGDCDAPGHAVEIIHQAYAAALEA